MPRVVPDQRSKFENEEFFRKLSRECEIKYTGFRDRPHEERQARFQNASRDGRSEIAFVATGTNLSLQFFAANLLGDQRQVPAREYVDFERETGKVEQVQDKHTHVSLCCSSPFAMVIWSELQQRDWI
ncbi:core-binding factor subunit beta-like [Notothenia coriiceps]|uniref:Core-binding factor subunit beta-like n=1 Tax=Notothenia coriiceps TaxID=8208 RepID=A0A6I9N6D2_9TELE|nr:PREDICTED: core-binding factor subunit beta-like [Notothenia coriiceps]